MLERENVNSAKHGVPPLQLDSELTARAQRWADVLAKEKCDRIHMNVAEPKNPDLKYKGKPTGENIMKLEKSAINYSDEKLGAAAADAWYAEVKNYPWPALDANNKKGKTGYFTQTVWKASSLVGYAVQRGGEGCGRPFVVARYWPAGNVWKRKGPNEYSFEEYAKNVLPPIE